MKRLFLMGAAASALTFGVITAQAGTLTDRTTDATMISAAGPTTDLSAAKKKSRKARSKRRTGGGASKAGTGGGQGGEGGSGSATEGQSGTPRGMPSTPTR